MSVAVLDQVQLRRGFGVPPTRPFSDAAIWARYSDTVVIPYFPASSFHCVCMGSTSILNWTRCQCGRSCWPLHDAISSGHCVVCMDRMYLREVFITVSRDWFWIVESSMWGNICDFVPVMPLPQGRRKWRTHFLRWILCTRRSAFCALTYTGNGLAGSIDEETDVIDLIILYCV